MQSLQSLGPLGLGGSTLGGVYGRISQERVNQLVDEALSLGIRYIDTSPWYGHSEESLGVALSRHPRDSYVLATKTGRFCQGERMFDFSSERTRRSVENSLRLLQVDTLDVVQVHDCEFAQDLEQIARETIPELRKMKAEGKIRHIGVTGLPLQMLRDLLEMVEVDMVLSYCHHTLFDDSLVSSGFLRDMVARGIVVVNASPLGMGLLTPAALPEWHPAPESLQHAAKSANHAFPNLPSLAVAFSASNPLLATTLIGCNELAHLRSAHEAVTGKYPKEDIEAARQMFASLDKRSWSSGEYNL